LKYFVGILAGFIVVAAIHFTLVGLSLGKAHSYQSMMIRAWYDHKNEALEQVPSPRVIVIGGSSGLYGVNAELLSEITGWPAINYATHGALYLPYHLSKALEAAQPGDVILLHPELGLLNRNRPNVVSTQYMLEQDPAFVATRGLPEQFEWYLGSDYGEIVRRVASIWDEEVPNQKAVVRERVAATLTDLGSYRGHTAESRLPRMLQLVDSREPLSPFNRPGSMRYRVGEASEELAKFLEACRAKDISVFTAFSPIMYVDPAPDEEAIVKENWDTWLELYRELGLQPLGRPDQFLYSPDQFYDSKKHLTEEAMKQHTKKLATLLREQLPEHPSAGEDK